MHHSSPRLRHCQGLPPRRRKEEWRALHSHVSPKASPNALCKHDQKTRHVGLAHVAQLRISLCLTLAKFSVERQYAVAYVPGSFRDFPAPRVGAAVAGRPPYHFRGSGFHGSPDPLRPGGGYLVPLSGALVASRKAVPTNVKDQPPRPFTDKTKSLYPIIWAKTRGNLRW